MDDKLRMILSKDRIEVRIAELATLINREYEDKELHLVVVLKGSVFFACELAKQLTMPITMDYVGVSSYDDEDDGMVSSGDVVVTKELDEEVAGKHVLIVEDVIDSGTTLFYLKNLLLARNPASLEVISLLDKPARRLEEVEPDYMGFEIPNDFVVGFGLDYNQKYRNLPYIAKIED